MTLKIHSTIIPLLLSTSVVLYACTNVNQKKDTVANTKKLKEYDLDTSLNKNRSFSVSNLVCDDSTLLLFVKVEEGDLDVLKGFIQNGGNPLHECYDNTRAAPVLMRLADRIMHSHSYPMVKYYFSLQLNQKTKDDMLEYYLEDRYPKITEFLIKQKARLSFDRWNCLPLDQRRYEIALSHYSYTVDWSDSKYGESDFMYYAQCPCPDGAKEILKTLKYLKSKGADHTLTNNNGQTALDLATHPDIIAYLKSLK